MTEYRQIYESDKVTYNGCVEPTSLEAVLALTGYPDSPTAAFEGTPDELPTLELATLWFSIPIINQSYDQRYISYPHGGGSYSLGKENVREKRGTPVRGSFVGGGQLAIQGVSNILVSDKGISLTAVGELKGRHDKNSQLSVIKNVVAQVKPEKSRKTGYGFRTQI